ncbi:MAG: peptide-methionine (S)-S-oxide reductase MsrA [Myxococcales bacterium]|nr:peptide-methionine (S)-S-oxide reductase MsrA [Myxococcales bacterium]MCB9708047.1 peptide-methionine (S)-S-oxide reductase MsrA [Myxococcales bacterium]
MNAVKAPTATETAIFAGGCFWCMEAAYDKVNGVISTVSGYTGGETQNPTYEEVSTSKTGHFEAVRVTYDPSKVSYRELLDVFWHNIDPTVKDRQFCDVGSQYRSAIFYADASQYALAAKSKATIEDRLRQTSHTELRQAKHFYPAEAYHQKFYKKQPERYESYKAQCGRDQRLKELWSDPR